MKQQLTLQTTHQQLNLNHTSQENLHIQPTNNQQQEQQELQTKTQQSIHVLYVKCGEIEKNPMSKGVVMTDKFNRNEDLVEFSVCKQIE